MKKVAIIKYNAGNVRSVLCAMQRLGAEAVLTDDADAIRSADRVIFPGVGQARSSMDYLEAHGLADVIHSLRQPVLGICIGMQLLCRSSEEGAPLDAATGRVAEPTPCLGRFDVPVVRFRPGDEDLKVPHMGWNRLSFPTTAGEACPLFEGVEPGAYVYYVHSYHAPVCAHTVATTTYGHAFSAALRCGNFFATQFHPEKSGPVGERILRNFLGLRVEE